MKHEGSPNFSASDGQNTGQPAEAHTSPEEPLIDRLFPPLEEGDRRRLFMEKASHNSGFQNHGPNAGFETVRSEADKQD